MFNKEAYKELIAERIKTDWEYRIDQICKEERTLMTKDEPTFDDFISYMKNEMTGIEYIYLSEVSDEISQEKPSYEFIDAYKFLAKKYPEETKAYHILAFIEAAEAFVEAELGERGKQM